MTRTWRPRTRYASTRTRLNPEPPRRDHGLNPNGAQHRTSQDEQANSLFPTNDSSPTNPVELSPLDNNRGAPTRTRATTTIVIFLSWSLTIKFFQFAACFHECARFARCGGAEQPKITKAHERPLPPFRQRKETRFPHNDGKSPRRDLRESFPLSQFAALVET